MTFYDAACDEERGWLNRAVFEEIHVDVIEDEPRLVLQDALVGLNMQGRTAGEGAGLAAAEKQQKTPGGLSPIGGSNVYNVAETERCELSVPKRKLHLRRVDRAIFGLRDRDRSLAEARGHLGATWLYPYLDGER